MSSLQPQLSPNIIRSAVIVDYSNYHPRDMAASQRNQQVMPMWVWAALILMATVCFSGVSCAPKKTKNLEEQKMLKQQKIDLDKMKCEPKLSVVQVEGELEFHDPLADEDFFPKVVAINRCSEAFSFCGNAAMGMPVGECQPVKIKKRRISASYIKGSQMVSQEVLVNEHMACECKSEKAHDQKEIKLMGNVTENVTTTLLNQE